MNLTPCSPIWWRLHFLRSIRVRPVAVGLLLLVMLAVATPSALATGSKPGAFGALAAPSIDGGSRSKHGDVLAPRDAKRCRPKRLTEPCARAVERADSLLEASGATRQALSASTSASGNSLSL